MSVVKKTELQRALAHLLSEVGMISRDQVTLTGGEVVKAGAVLGLVSGTGKYVEHAPGAGDGSQHAVAVACYDYDATDGDMEIAVHTRLCELQGDLLVWPTGITDNQKATGIAKLAATFVIVR